LVSDRETEFDSNGGIIVGECDSQSRRRKGLGAGSGGGVEPRAGE